MELIRGDRDRGAFTLVEIMVVIAIIGLMAAVVVPSVMHRMAEARVKTTQLQIRELENGIDMYKLDNAVYPDQLGSLVQRPANAKKWPTGGYMKELPLDGWGNEFVYVHPGNYGPYDLVSYGADGMEGGEGEDADITNYSMVERQ
jgi:general secretion pathway protein G